MKPEKRHLMLDLMDEEQAARREATFLAGGRILRRRRWRRVALRSFAVAAVLGAVVFSIQKPAPPRVRVIASVPEVPAQPKSLTDEELLALFPETPVALASLENGKKRLIFPRAGDEAKFVTKM